MIGPIFAKLYAAYGDQHWWAADSTFEIMIGAVLVQDIAWHDAEKLLEKLKQNDALAPTIILNIADKQLAEWLPSADFSSIKIKRLKDFAQWYQEQGEFAELDKLDTVDLRNELLEVNGLAKETADLILLYAFERLVFVIDADTRRILHRVGLFNGEQPYEELQHLIELSLDSDIDLFNEYHALIVRHARERCRKEPVCAGCPLGDICLY